MPIIVSGPCAAENREQVLTVAKQLAAVGISVFRAGVWKPRTSPNTFQGVGEEALAWLVEAKQLTGLPVATEVATPEHVQKALAIGIDYLWIGARTAANPIAVQAIADVLPAGAKVMLKNPVNEDTELWLGNIERLEKAGAEVMAVHRGCNHKPCWAMAFDLRSRRPELPLLLDPSHMSGDAKRVPMLCQQAMDLNYDGLMVEVHHMPAEALSDAKQQITPAELKQVLSGLVLRKNVGVNAELLALRQQIDETDDALWALLLKRMQISDQIGALKRAAHLPVLQSERYAELVSRRMAWSRSSGLNPEFVRSILQAIHEESCSRQLKDTLLR